MLKLTTDKHEASRGLCDSRASCLTTYDKVYMPRLGWVGPVFRLDHLLLLVHCKLMDWSASVVHIFMT